jgi:hypothetical protein
LINVSPGSFLISRWIVEYAMEAAEFFWGPHDGLVLEMEEIRNWCRLVRAKNKDEVRLFALMPSPFDWGRVVRGEVGRDGPFDTIYAYELVRTGDRIAFLLRDPDEFTAAADGLVDQSDP